MKTVKSLIVLIVVAFVSFSAFAADVRVFKMTSGPEFHIFVDSLKKLGLLQEENGIKFFDTKKVLAASACAFGKDDPNIALLHEKFGTNEKCQGIFIARNNLSATMTLDEFKAKGQDEGLWLADISSKSSVAAAPKVVASEPKVAAAPQENKVLNAFAAGLASLKKRIDSLYENGNEPMTKHDVEVILGTQAKEAAGRDKAFNARIAALESQTKVTDGKVDTLSGRVDGIEKIVNDSLLLKWENVLLGIIGVIVFALIAMAFFVWRKAKAPVPQRGSVPLAVAANEPTRRKAA